MRLIVVTAKYDDDASVWYVEESNVPGLRTEAPTIEARGAPSSSATHLKTSSRQPARFPMAEVATRSSRTPGRRRHRGVESSEHVRSDRAAPRSGDASVRLAGRLPTRPETSRAAAAGADRRARWREDRALTASSRPSARLSSSSLPPHPAGRRPRKRERKAPLGEPEPRRSSVGAAFAPLARGSTIHRLRPRSAPAARPSPGRGSARCGRCARSAAR